MLSVTHGLVGATIAAQPISPIISLSVAFGSHFLLDLVPHWDWGVRFRKRPVITSFWYSLVDGLAAIAVVYGLFQAGQSFRPIVWLGMFTGMGQDFLDAPETFFRKPLPIPTTKFHRLFHANEKNVLWGMLPQALTLAACLLFLSS